GLPTRRSGSKTGGTICRSAPRPGRTGTSPVTRAASPWITKRHWEVRYDHPRGGRPRPWRRFDAFGGAAAADHVAVAVSAAATGVRGRRDRAVAVAHRGQGAAVAAVRHAAHRHRDRERAAPPARHRRVL